MQYVLIQVIMFVNNKEKINIGSSAFEKRLIEIVSIIYNSSQKVDVDKGLVSF